jgi:hypothetical protein
VERLLIAFGDGDGELGGLALAGAGLLVAAAGAVHADPAPTVVGRDDGGALLRAGDDIEIILDPLGPPAPLGAGAAVVCRAHGSVGARPLDGLATISRGAAGEPAPLERSVSVWLGPALAIALAARRPRLAAGHGDEQIDAAILRGEPLAAVPIGDPRISTTYDGEGRPIHFGLELWETDESEFPDRAAGEAIAQGELTEPDGARSLVTFLACHGQGRRGAGVYVLTRRG